MTCIKFSPFIILQKSLGAYNYIIILYRHNISCYLTQLLSKSIPFKFTLSGDSIKLVLRPIPMFIERFKLIQYAFVNATSNITPDVPVLNSTAPFFFHPRFHSPSVDVVLHCLRKSNHDASATHFPFRLVLYAIDRLVKTDFELFHCILVTVNTLNMTFTLLSTCGKLKESHNIVVFKIPTDFQIPPTRTSASEPARGQLGCDIALPLRI